MPRARIRKRPVAGRKPAYSDGALRLAITVRFDGPQAEAVQAWCARRQVSPVTLVREVALLRVGASNLGNGIVEGSATRSVRMVGPCSMPVKLNDEQHAAIVGHCQRAGVAPGVFLREATLAHVGAAELGVSGGADALRRAVSL